MSAAGDSRFSGSRLTRNYVIALSLVAALSSLAYVSLQSVIASQEDDAPVINVSGRQRMLSQRTALFAQRYATATNAAERERSRAKLSEAAELMRRSHRGLIDGDSQLNLPGIESEDIRKMYFAPPLEVDRQVREYLERVDRLLAAPPARLGAANPDLIFIQSAAPEGLLDALDALVNRYERESRDRVQNLEYMETGVLLLTLLILLLEALLIFRPMVRKIVRETENLRRSERSLSEAKDETDDILDSVEQGFFLLSSDESGGGPPMIGTQYSRALERMLDREDLAGRPMLDVLGSQTPPDESLEARERSLQAFLKLLFRADIRDETLENLNPFRKFEFRRGNLLRTLQFQFRRVYRESKISAVMVSVQDLTRETELAQELAVNREASQNQMERLFQILQIEAAPLNLFIEHLDRELDRMSRILAREDDDLSQTALRAKLLELFRSVHTVKGEASLLRLHFIESELHALEDRIDLALNRRDADAPPLEGRDFIPVVTAIQALRVQRGELGRLLDRLLKFHSSWDGESRTAGDSVDWLPNLFAGAYEFANSERKRIRIEADGYTPTHIPATLRPVLREVMIQLFRNAVCHGLERPAEREAAGKTTEGLIRISSRRLGPQQASGNNGSTSATASEKSVEAEGMHEGERVVLTIEDDGRGVQIENIRQKALATAPPDRQAEIETWSDDRLIDRIFEPGVSTREQADALSGRGIGMNLVRSRVHEYGGCIRVRTASGRFTAFEIELPVPASGGSGLRSSSN